MLYYEKASLLYLLPKDVVVVFVVTGHRYHGTKGDANGVKDLSSCIDPHLQHKIKKNIQAFICVHILLLYSNMF